MLGAKPTNVVHDARGAADLVDPFHERGALRHGTAAQGVGESDNDALGSEQGGLKPIACVEVDNRVTGKKRSITSHPGYCEAAAGGSCHVRTGGAGTRAVGDGAVKNREFPTRVGSALWFRVFPWAGLGWLAGWAAPHDDIEPSL